MMGKDYYGFIWKGELITFVHETDQFYLTIKHRPHSSWGLLSVGRSSMEKVVVVALEVILLEVKKNEGRYVLGLPSFPEYLH